MSAALSDPAVVFLSALIQLPAVLKAHKLTPVQFTLLAALHGGPLAVQTLAVRLYGNTSRPITELIHQVVGKGFATRIRSEDDTRVRYVELTQRGREMVEAIANAIS